MIELIAAAVSGAVVGGGVVWWARWRTIDRINSGSEYFHDMEVQRADRGWDTLYALRSNCFIHNEKGHFTPYSQASVERRVKAETPKEVV